VNVFYIGVKYGLEVCGGLDDACGILVVLVFERRQYYKDSI